MPLYEFQCESCHKIVELMLKYGENKRKCPECGKLKLRKLISQTIYHDTHSPMHPRRGRGKGGYGRIDPGRGGEGMDKHF